LHIASHTQVKALVAMGHFTRQSDWTAVIRHMQRLFSIMDIADRGRVISLVRCHAQLALKCDNEKERMVCADMLEPLLIKAGPLQNKVWEEWRVVWPLFAPGLGYRDNTEFRKVVNMCIICNNIIPDHLKAPFSSFSLYVPGEQPAENYRKSSCLDDMHAHKKTKKSMDVFVYGGCYTNDTSKFQFAGLDLPAMLVNYQQKKEDDYQAELNAASMHAGMIIDSPVHIDLDVASIDAGMTMNSPDQSFVCTSSQPKVSYKRKPSTNPERIERKRQRAEKREINRLLHTSTMTDACVLPLVVCVAPSILLSAALPLSDSVILGKQYKPGVLPDNEIVRMAKSSMVNATLPPVPSRGTLSTVSSSVATHRDSFYVTLTHRICGFKYASSRAVALHDMGPFEVGDDVFVKIGEILANNLQSQFINVIMRKIGMPYVEEFVLPVVFDVETWTAHSLKMVSKDTTRWGPAMLNMMERVVARHDQLRLDVHMKVSTLFKGVRLGWLDRNEESWCHRILSDETRKQMLGKTLCMVLFVVVYFGVTDSGPFNCMVDADGRVLLVDISCAESARMIKYHGLGLFPSGHKYAQSHIQEVVRYVRNNRAELADFLVSLKASAPPNPYLVMDAQCPFFDDANLRALRSDDASEPYFLYLLREISRNPCSKKEVALPFHAHRDLLDHTDPEHLLLQT